MAFRFSALFLSLARRVRALWVWGAFGAFALLVLVAFSGSPLCASLPLWLAVAGVLVALGLLPLAWALAFVGLAFRALSCLFLVRRPCPAWGSASRRACWRACFFLGGGLPGRAAVFWRRGAGSALPRWRCVSPAGLARARSFPGCVVLSAVPAVVRRRSGVVVAFWVLAGGSFPCESKNTNVTPASAIACGVKIAASLSLRRKTLQQHLTNPP